MTDEASEPRARNPEELVELFSGDVWRFASSQISRAEDAEDVVMEVFAAAFGDFPRVQRAESQRVWLLSIARRKVADSLRKRYRRAEQPYSSIQEPMQSAHWSETQLATREALKALPEHERQVLILKYVNGLSTEEVGMVIRKSLAATNSLLQRARQNMRESLGPQIMELSGETR